MAFISNVKADMSILPVERQYSIHCAQYTYIEHFVSRATGTTEDKSIIYSTHLLTNTSKEIVHYYSANKGIQKRH
jgi:hypothetical protein